MLSLVVLALSLTQYRHLSKQIRTNRLATLLIMVAMVAVYFGMQSLISGHSDEAVSTQDILH